MQDKIVTDGKDYSRPAPASRPSPGGSLGRGILLSAAASCILAFSCSLDYGPTIADALAETMPDMVLVDFSRTVVENGNPRFVLEAARGEIYSSQKKTRLEGVSFSEYASDGSGVLVAQGRADSGVFWSDTESADLFGAVSFYSERDGIRVESGNLRWDGQKRTLSSGGDSTTTLSDRDGSRLSGSGFQADAARRSFSFSRRVDGALAVRQAAGDSEPAEGQAP